MHMLFNLWISQGVDRIRPFDLPEESKQMWTCRQRSPSKRSHTWNKLKHQELFNFNACDSMTAHPKKHCYCYRILYSSTIIRHINTTYLTAYPTQHESKWTMLQVIEQITSPFVLKLYNWGLRYLFWVLTETSSRHKIKM